MGSKKWRRNELDRLWTKTLDEQFMTEIREGLNCSAFEAEAVLGVVHEVCAVLWDGGGAGAARG